MKKALRDILLIVVLFGAILLAPLVMDALSSDKSDAPIEKPKPAAAPEKPEEVSSPGPVTEEGMPPQPQPSVPGESAINKLMSIEDAVSSKPLDADMTVTPMDTASCPTPDIGGQQDYDPKIETRQTNDTMIIPVGAIAQKTIDGNGGVDTVKIPDGGAVDIDGKHIIRFEIYDIRNGQPNALRIFAAGLANMNGRHALVIGDKGGDIVALDPCLQWNDPIVIEDGVEPLLRYDAHDNAGNPASVSVTDGVKVIKGN